MPLPAIPPSAPFAPHVYTQVKYVDPVNGSNSWAGTYEKPWATVAYALSAIGNSATTLYLAPGTHAGATSWNLQNTSIVGLSPRSGTVNLTGYWNFSHTSSSIRVQGVNFAAGFIHSGAGNLAMYDCQSGSTTLQKTGAGYFESTNCDWSNANGFSISNGTASLIGGRSLFVTVSGSSTSVGITGSLGAISPSVSAGSLGIFESTCYGTSAGANAITQTGGIAYIRNALCYDSASNITKVSLTGGIYGWSNVTANKALSTLTSTNAASQSWFDNIGLLSVSAFSSGSYLGIDSSGNIGTLAGSSGGSGITRSVSTVTSNTTLGATDLTDYVCLSNSASSLTITLPTAVGNSNRYTVKNINTGIVTLAGTSSQTFDGSAAPTLSQNTSVDLISDGANWRII